MCPFFMFLSFLKKGKAHPSPPAVQNQGADWICPWSLRPPAPEAEGKDGEEAPVGPTWKWYPSFLLASHRLAPVTRPP